ncbi:MAG: pseudouridine-5'-phosphate glycosidase [Actinomycetota bacterium]|nr:pseudouridine-5'-phosphate glycosidase [Actinomycetota bacterium]
MIRAGPAVAHALSTGRAVVALESTLIAHGLPRPLNLEVARDAEAIVRAEGAEPATVGVIDGVATVGLDGAQLETMATSDEVLKLSLRDLPAAVAQGRSGATTVAATAWLAARAGIPLFATGGLGGVHRGAAESWDESADLEVLSRTPIAVVSSGVKSILDVPATLERLESLNVTVVGWKTFRFPGFYITDSGAPIDWAVASEAEAAQLIRAQGALGLRANGLLIANAVSEDEQLDPHMHDRVLKASLAELKDLGIRGKGVTPFLLERFNAATGGESLRVNAHLVRSNAQLAARISVALAGRP